VKKLTLSAKPGRLAAGAQILFVRLSVRARVSAQVYVGGVARKVAWRKGMPAGTTIARVRLPKLGKGQRFTIVLRATAGTRKAMIKLPLRA
jgi:hypothetical protein